MSFMERSSTDLSPKAIAALLDGPAMRAPPGITPQLTNTSGEQAWFYAVAIICLVLSSVFLLLRLYVKARIVRRLDLTDYVLILAFLSYIAMVVIGRQASVNGAAVHQWNVKLKNLFNILHWMNINEIIYGIAIFLVKLAILLQYIQLLCPNRTINPIMFYGAWTLITVNFLFYFASTWITLFSCTPRERIWNKLMTTGYCPINYNHWILSSQAFNIVSDIMILLLPAITILKLRLPLRKRVGIILLFALGLLANIFNIMTMVFAIRITKPNADVSWNTAWLGLPSFAEINLGIIVNCTFSLPKLVDEKGKRIRQAFSSTNKPASLLRGSNLRRDPNISQRNSEGFPNSERVSIHEAALNQSFPKAIFMHHDDDVDLESYHSCDGESNGSGLEFPTYPGAAFTHAR